MSSPVYLYASNAAKILSVQALLMNAKVLSIYASTHFLLL